MTFPALDITWAVFRSSSSFSLWVLFFNDKLPYSFSQSKGSYIALIGAIFLCCRLTILTVLSSYSVDTLVRILSEKLKTARMDSNTSASIFNQYLLAIL